MKDGYYINTVIFGNTEIDLYGYNNEIEYAYIGDHNISEMVKRLDLWKTIEDELYEQV